MRTPRAIRSRGDRRLRRGRSVGTQLPRRALSSSRRRSATGDSPVAAASSRSRWSREKCARGASEAPSAARRAGRDEVDQVEAGVRRDHPRIAFDVRLDPTPTVTVSDRFLVRIRRRRRNLAERIQSALRGAQHKTMATSARTAARASPAPSAESRTAARLSGPMWKAVKALDLQRDLATYAQCHRGPRVVVGRGPKLAGVAEEIEI